MSAEPAVLTQTGVRREEIVTVVAAVFARNAYANVGLQDIAEVLGMRGPSLYHHSRCSRPRCFS
jgi:AcrR family transcriptional regulator